MATTNIAEMSEMILDVILGFVFSIGSEYILNSEDIWLVEAGFWEMNWVVNDILVLKMVAKIVFVQNHKFEILNPNPKPQSQILNPNPKSISTP